MKAEIVLGPPGTGKTTKLLEIVDEELAQGTPPDRIAYVTFTKRGAEEAINRATEKFKLSPSSFPYFRTLHSLCYRALNIQSSSVVNTKKLMEFGEWAGVKITGRWAEDGTFSGFELGDRIMFMENLARVRMLSLREQYDLDDDGISWQTVDYVARSYKSWKSSLGLFDYTDMLSGFISSGVRLRLDVVLDDEAQDQSKLQWEVLKHISGSARRVVIAGDDDQAIYKWAGADVDTLIDLPGSVSVLGQSWRVPIEIQKVAGGLISSIQHRRDKAWAPRAEKGRVEVAFNFDDVDISEGSVLILARNIYIIRDLVEPTLKRSGIIYEYNGHSSVSAPMLAAIVAWEKLRAGEAVSVPAIRTVYDYLTSGVGVARGFKKLNMFPDDALLTMSELHNSGGLLVDTIWHEALDKLPAADVAYILAARTKGDKILSKPRVRVSTIHAAKGGEADHVVLLKEMAKRTHREMSADEDSEKRVWYVGVTRAREKLTIVESTTKQSCPWL